jgi:uncharacterized membrane protein (DUF4010 family)
MKLLDSLPPDAVKLVLVLAFSFLIGLQREERKTKDAPKGFGGVRTFPLIGLVGYGLGVIGGPSLVPISVGALVVGGFLWLSYYRKLTAEHTSGATSELSGVLTYVLGGLVAYDHLWIAAALFVVCLLLLELKVGLESLADRVSPEEIAAAGKFLLMAVVLLPLVPNEAFGRFQINPFKALLVVIAVSGVSFFSYTLQKLTHSKSSVLASAILGGAYSSTATTVALARQAASDDAPDLFAGSILTASGVMYIRLALLLALFNFALFRLLALPFVALAAAGIGVGIVWARRSPHSSKGQTLETSRNPLEMRAAVLFAAIFLAVTVVTRLVTSGLGRGGLYSLAAVMGATDVDPFILGLAQAHEPGARLAAAAIVIASASNNLVKGAYAWFFSGRKTGRRAAAALGALALCGLVPLIWL